MPTEQVRKKLSRIAEEKTRKEDTKKRVEGRTAKAEELKVREERAKREGEPFSPGGVLRDEFTGEIKQVFTKTGAKLIPEEETKVSEKNIDALTGKLTKRGKDILKEKEKIAKRAVGELGEVSGIARTPEQKAKEIIQKTDAILEEREIARKEGRAETVTEEPETLPVDQQQAQIPIDEEVVQPIDRVEETPDILAGGAMPITSGNLFDVATLFSGVGILKAGGVATLAKLSKITGKEVGKEVVKKAGKEVAEKTIKKGLITTGTSILKSQVKKFGAAALAFGTVQVAFKQLKRPENIIRGIDADMSQIRETISLEVAFARSGKPYEALNRLDEYEDVISEFQAQIQEQKIAAQYLSANPKLTAAAERRAKKLFVAIELAKRDIARSIVTGDANSLQDTLDILSEMLILED